MIAVALDPDGRRVVLDGHGWSHIKRGHTDMRRRLREIMGTVREPDVRLQGRFETEEWFLTEAAGRLPWLQVVVHYEGGEGWVVTAFRRTALPRS